MILAEMGCGLFCHAGVVGEVGTDGVSCRHGGMSDGDSCDNGEDGSGAVHGVRG